MRILLDTNVLISYLISAHPERSATSAILRLALTGEIILLYVPGVVEELNRKLSTRADLAARISPASAGSLIQWLRARAVLVQPIPAPYSEVTRDPKDDYLIAHAVVAEADYLVSWDRDLLDLHQIDRVEIVSPPELLALLREGDAVGGSGDE